MAAGSLSASRPGRSGYLWPLQWSVTAKYDQQTDSETSDRNIAHGKVLKVRWINTKLAVKPALSDFREDDSLIGVGQPLRLLPLLSGAYRPSVPTSHRS